MARPRRTVRCIFCGLQKAASREHAIPRWVRERLALTSNVTVEVNSAAATRWPNLYVKLDRTVCADCNSGWMSALEQKVKPFLGPMLVNQHGVELDAIQQQDLARWAVLKILLLELSLRQQHPRRRSSAGYLASEAELAWLAARSDPPPRSRVWFGAFDAQGQVAASTQGMLLTTALTGRQDPLLSRVATMTLGYVIMQVFSIDYVKADSCILQAFDTRPPAPVDQALTRIWPIAHHMVRWPPSAYVDRTVLERVIIWARSGR